MKRGAYSMFSSTKDPARRPECKRVADWIQFCQPCASSVAMQQVKGFGAMLVAIVTVAVAAAGLSLAQTQPSPVPDCPPGFTHPLIARYPSPCVPASVVQRKPHEPAPPPGLNPVGGCWQDSECPKGWFYESVDRPPGKSGVCSNASARWKPLKYPLTPHPKQQ